ncbi:hypothetical protein [Mucilaginibacter sp.]|uniref:hypothetical protein n=1 Tax=Mucilaginibacter sp. TaxID=1882438 RepID=UPI00284DF171|nr:hypothetical protein [Mucilaginibacter sp.]MDR3693858.1 hypothetical protein [Mucilaginibacter sp.]
MYHPFSIADTLKASWGVLRKNFITLIIYSVISLFVYGFINFITLFLTVEDSLLNLLILFFLQMITQSYLALSFYKLILTLMDREFYEFSLKDILPSIKMTFNFVVIAFAYAVLVVILFFVNRPLENYEGLLFLAQMSEMILVLFLLVRSIFCVCFIVDDDSQPFESLKQSFGITKDNFFKTLFIGVIIVGIMILTLIPIVSILSLFKPNKDNLDFLFKISFYIWFVIAFPIVQVIIMVTYRKLVYSHLDVDDDVTEAV